MGPANASAEVKNQGQRKYARLAGILLLGVIFLAIGSGVVLSRIAGNGSFVQTAARVAGSERSYRVVISSLAVVSLTSPLLAFALYETLKPVNQLLAQLGMIFSLADSFLGLIVWMCSFVRLHLYFSPHGAGTGPTPDAALFSWPQQ